MNTITLRVRNENQLPIVSGGDGHWTSHDVVSWACRERDNSAPETSLDPEVRGF
jgi:hypothetical protein